MNAIASRHHNELHNVSHAADALNFLDPGCPRDEWIKLGMAAKAAGLSFDEFYTWSKGGTNYKSEGDCRAAWKSFKDSGGISAASLFQQAIAQGWKDSWSGSRDKVGVSIAKSVKTTPPAAIPAESVKALTVWELPICD
jgi:putative DNA primase/helicase